MGLLDEVGSILGGARQGGGADIAGIVQQVLAQSGGLEGLLQKLQQGGLGEAVSSWVGTGQNLLVSAEQIKAALDTGQLGDMASKLGMDGQQLSAQLAQHLPGLVDKLTPDGQLPQDADLLAQGVGLLKGFFKN